ncbi:hypothetical protein MNEG_14466 [Monoraphidium neglectum]|uniref:Uncharacterized protein n=1 Tax=Monoraphidium neglectum TaxID=145388 RepID=A0A0D2J085_9CHLO|nr:hypothetical protein MNEG_14466 [Monoraphidium neglectum]KIY93497.1 hypothetical protein MNEG_14466 [Monoraphidium neglectum]|eukprot:XP_013892517.1 hypothetical protein MNEG_14466 [Monoraphidium neglectum]
MRTQQQPAVSQHQPEQPKQHRPQRLKHEPNSKREQLQHEQPQNEQQQERQRQHPAGVSDEAAASTGVPALLLGDCFVTVNPAMGLLNMANESRAPRDRTRRRRAYQQQQQQQPQEGEAEAGGPQWDIDPAVQARLLLATPSQDGRRLFFVSRDAAEHMRRAVVLRRYNELLEARRQRERGAAAEEARLRALGGKQGGPNDGGGGGGAGAALPAHQAPAHAMRETWRRTEASGGWRWPWQPAAQAAHGSQEQGRAGQKPGAGSDTSGSSGVYDPLARFLADSEGSKPAAAPGQQQQQPAMPKSSSIASDGPNEGVGAGGGPAVHSWRQLLDSVTTNLQQLEEESIMQEGAAIAAALGRNRLPSALPGHRARGPAGPGAAQEEQQQHRAAAAAAAMRSYVARVPLDAALHAVCRDGGRNDLVVFEGDLCIRVASGG